MPYFRLGINSIKNVIMKNSEFAILILILEYTHQPLGACPSGSWLESYAAFRKPSEHVFKCRSQKTKNGDVGDTVHLQPMAHILLTNVIKGNKPDLTEPQTTRDNMELVAQGLKTRCRMMEMHVMSAYIGRQWESDRTAPVNPNFYCSFQIVQYVYSEQGFV